MKEMFAFMFALGKYYVYLVTYVCYAKSLMSVRNKRASYKIIAMYVAIKDFLFCDFFCFLYDPIEMARYRVSIKNTSLLRPDLMSLSRCSHYSSPRVGINETYESLMINVLLDIHITIFPAVLSLGI